MLTATGTVVELSGTRAVVACAGADYCARCAAGRGCGGALMGRMLGERLHCVDTRVPAELRLAAGDEVTIGLRDDAFLQGAFIVYLLPVLFLLMAAGITAWLAPGTGDAGAVLAAAGGLFAGLVLARYLARGRHQQTRFQPVILSARPPSYAGRACERV